MPYYRTGMGTLPSSIGTQCLMQPLHANKHSSFSFIYLPSLFWVCRKGGNGLLYKHTHTHTHTYTQIKIPDVKFSLISNVISVKYGNKLETVAQWSCPCRDHLTQNESKSVCSQKELCLNTSSTLLVFVAHSHCFISNQSQELL